MSTSNDQYATFFTERQARFLAFADIVLELYNRIVTDYPALRGRGAASCVLRTICESDEYKWLRNEYPSYSRNRSAICTIINKKTSAQRRLEAIRQKIYERTDDYAHDND